MVATAFGVTVWMRTISQKQRITKYPMLDWTHKDQVQLLAPHRSTQNLNSVSETIVRTLLELQQARCHDHCHGDPAVVPSHFHDIQTQHQVLNL